MNVLFSNPPFWVKEGSAPLRGGIRAGSRWPFTRETPYAPGRFRFGSYIPFPVFLASAAGWLEQVCKGDEVSGHGMRPDVKVHVRDSIARGESYAEFGAYLNELQPDWIVIETATSSWEHDQRILRHMKQLLPKVQFVVCGPVTAGEKANEALAVEGCVAAIRGEYEKGCVRVILNGERGIIPHDIMTKEEMNGPNSRWPKWDEGCAKNYFDACPKGQRPVQLQMWASRGCMYLCLAGDTPINTLHGMIPIKELADKGEPVQVYTYNRKTKEAKISGAINVQQTGSWEKLVRVHFDDGTHIDCTPEHGFLAFKWGNQFVGEKEWMCEAQDLKSGMHVRAIKEYQSADYIEVCWSRRGTNKKHRMIAEWALGRKLRPAEVVHHKDHNKLNNSPDNLEVCKNTKEHFSKHPEMAQRMRDNNPVKNMTTEWREKLRKAITGKKRSTESKERYRLAAIKREASRTKEYKDAAAKKMVSGRKGVYVANHRIAHVEVLPGLHSVYCMEVPETGWFYANNVLVKNCQFCVWPAQMTNNDPEGLGGRKVRFYTPEWIEGYIKERQRIMGQLGCVYFDDDTFNLGDKHVSGVCDVMEKLQIPWAAMCRADTISGAMWEKMKKSGCYGVKIGFESGSDRVVNRIIGKKLDLKEAADTARWLRKIGIAVHGTFMVGLPGELPEEKDMTLAFINELYQTGGLDTHQLSGTATLDGTPLANLKPGQVQKNFPDAKKDENFIESPDGQKKIEQISNSLIVR